MRRWPSFWLPLCAMTVLAVLVLTLTQATAHPTPTPCPDPQKPFDPPDQNTVGLAWGDSRFWAADRGAEESWIYYYCRDCTSSKWRKVFQWKDGRLGPIAWGGGGLWVVDEQRGKLFFLDLMPVPPRLTREVTIPPTALRKPPAITGLAWDGSSLWLVTGCGLCSSFYRIDPTGGRLLQSFFPKCEPRGLAFDGEFLWTVGYNGDRWPPRLDRRRVTQEPWSAVSSHTLLKFVPAAGGPFPRDPTALAARGNSLWAVDRATGVIFEVVADRRELSKAPITPTPLLKKAGP